MYDSQRLLALEDSWFFSSRRNMHVLGLAILVLCAAVPWIVYQTGGTAFVYAHLAYLPVILAASGFGIRGAMLVAIVLALLLGPYMPLNVSDQTHQTTANWLFRGVQLALAALVAGGLFDHLKRQLEHFRTLSLQDDESELPNRRALEQRIAQWLDRTSLRADVEGGRLYLMQCKIVNFSEIVSVTDYRETVELLSHLREVLCGVINEPVQLFRTATDEFAVLIELPKRRDSVEILRRATKEIAGPHQLGDLSTHVDVTIGIGWTTGQDSEPGGAQRLVRQSFLAMLHSLEQQTEIAIFHRNLEPDTDKLRLLGEVSGAMVKREFEMFYQPKLDASSHKLLGAEALLRWRHPSRGLVPPGMFIPQLERTSLINPCTFYVLERVLEQAVLWQVGERDIKIAINISVRNLQHTGFLRTVRRMVKQSGIAPKNIDLEITESAIARLGRAQLLALTELREAGFEISIDDFGTGYSSLAYLKSLPVTQLKIDQCFIRNLSSDPMDRQIVLASISLAHRLGLKTIAEGVEDLATAQFLGDAGCDAVQGFFFSRPLAADDFSPWVSGNINNTRAPTTEAGRA